MNIKRAKQEIIDTIGAYLQKEASGDYRIPVIRQRPVLLMGPPGIGKTQIMEQIASECDIALVAYTITHHTRQSAIGLPFISTKEYGGKQYSVTRYTMSEIIASVYDRMAASGKTEGILFIDEINCVSETLAPAMLQFLQCKMFGNLRIPKGWIIVASGNMPEYNKSVRDFDIVTLDRVKVINVEPNFDVWKEYAYRVGIHSAVISYLDIHSENFFRCETTVDGKRFVTPRGWQDLSEMIFAYEDFGNKMDMEVVVQYLQYPKIAQDFANYLELYYKYNRDYQVDQIISGPIPEGILGKIRYAPFDERLQIISLLLSRLQGQFRKVREYDRRVSHVFKFLKEFHKREKCAEEMSGEIANETRTEASGAQVLEEAYGAKALEEASGAKAFEDNAALFEGMLSGYRQNVERRIEAGHNEKDLRDEYFPVFSLLDKYFAIAREQRTDMWEALQKEFEKEKVTLETEEYRTSQMLEYSFDFMEQAFGESQEMVFFITELSANEHAMWFIGENDCPRYYRYNKALLFEERGAEVKKELDKILSEMVGEKR